MSIKLDTKEKIQKALLNAIRSKDNIRKRTLRMAISSIKLAEIKEGNQLDETALMNVLQKEIKIDQETIEGLKKAGRENLIKEKMEEISILMSFLPKPISDKDLRHILEKITQETGALNIKDMGRVMKIAIPQIQGRATNNRISKTLKEILLLKKDEQK